MAGRAAIGPSLLGAVGGRRAAADRLAGDADRRRPRAETCAREDRRASVGYTERWSGPMAKLAPSLDGRWPGVRSTGGDRRALHRDAAPRNRAGGNPGRIRGAERPGQAAPGRLREPLSRFHPRRLAHRSLPGGPVAVTHPPADRSPGSERRAAANAAAQRRHPDPGARPRDRGTGGREGGGDRADRPGGAGIRPLGEPDRGVRRSGPVRGPGIRRRPRRAAAGDRSPLQEAAGADRRGAHHAPTRRWNR